MTIKQNLSFLFHSKKQLLSTLLAVIVITITIFGIRAYMVNKASEEEDQLLKWTPTDGFIFELKEPSLAETAVNKAKELKIEDKLGKRDIPADKAEKINSSVKEQKIKIEGQQKRFIDELATPNSNEKLKIAHALKSKPIALNTSINAVVIHNLSDAEAAQIAYSPEVKKAVRNIKFKTELMNSIPLIGANQVWTQVKDASNAPVTGKGITVGIIDSGIDYTNPDFGSCTKNQFINSQCAKVKGGYDFVNSDPDPMDDYGHGTHVAGTVAANDAIKGVAPDATLYAYKVCDNSDNCYGDAILSAIDRSIDPNIDSNFSDHFDVINLSLGGNGDPDDVFSKAIDNAVDNGVVAVVSAGNEGPNNGTIGSPGSAQEAITVGASWEQNYAGDYFGEHNPLKDQVTMFSSRGPVKWNNNKNILFKPDVIAPGALICSSRMDSVDLTKWAPYYVPCLDDRHILLAGTSQAAPHVAGLAALILQEHPNWTPINIKTALTSTATKLNQSGTTTQYPLDAQGYGRVNALTAISLPETPPTAKIMTNGLQWEDNLPIIGTATCENFQQYSIFYKTEKSDWILFNTSSTKVTDGNLANLDTSTLIGDIDLKLIVSGNGQNIDAYGRLYIKKLIITSPLSMEDYYRSNFSYPISGGAINIKGYIGGKNFDHYDMSWCAGSKSLPQSDSDCTLSAQQNKTGFTLENSGTKYVSYDGLLGKWNPQSVTNLTSGIYYIKVNYYKKDGSIMTEDIHIWLDSTIKAGWPITRNCLNLGCKYSRSPFFEGQPILADINKDKKDEIIFSDGSQIEIIDNSGNELSGWPYKFNNNLIYGSRYMNSPPVVGDIDGDGSNEIVATYNTSIGSSEFLIALNKSGSLLPGFPKKIGYLSEGYGAPLALADINNDGKLEISSLVRLYIGGVLVTHMQAYDYTGNQIIDVQIGNDEGNGWGWPFDGVLAVGDINNDGIKEIITTGHFSSSSTTPGYSIYVFDAKGKILSGWPKSLSADIVLDTTPIIVDFDNNGYQEILINTLMKNSITRKLDIFDFRGNELSGWPKLVNNVAVGDILGDKTVKLTASNDLLTSCLMIFNKDGSNLAGWADKINGCGPGNHYAKGSLTLFNLNTGQGSAIAVYAPYIGYLFNNPRMIDMFQFYDKYGKLINPNLYLNGRLISHGLAIGDVDGDGKNEIVAATVPQFPLKDQNNGNYQITVYESSGGPTLNQWPQPYHDSQHSNNYKPIKFNAGLSLYSSSGDPGDTTILKTIIMGGGKNIVGRKINFSVDGIAAGNAFSDANGIAQISWTIPKTFTIGLHNVTASYDGATDDWYNSTSRTTSALTVGAPKQNISFSLYAASGGIGQTVTLKSLVYSGGKPIPGLTIQFAVDGVNVGSAISGATDVSLPYTIPETSAIGLHNVTVSFAGNTSYNSATRTTPALNVKLSY